MGSNKPILILHDGDRIGRAIVSQLLAARAAMREVDASLPADDIVAAAFGCRAIIAVGDRSAANPAVLFAANMPGVSALVVFAQQLTEFTRLRRHGVPYTVLRAAPLLEDLVAALEPIAASGKLVLDEKGDVELSFVAADDVAACAIAAVDHDDYCGRIVELRAPEPLTVSAASSALAHARGKKLKVSTWPRWMCAAMRAFGRSPFRVPEKFVKVELCEDASPLHPSAWRSIEDVAATTERRNDHALGMQ
jgi:hypothetical protein